MILAGAAGLFGLVAAFAYGLTVVGLISAVILLYGLGWGIYFACSRRVRFTYGAGDPGAVR